MNRLGEGNSKILWTKLRHV